LKRPASVNVFKTAKASKRETPAMDEGGSGGSKSYMSQAERLMKEDQARKSARAQGGGGYGGFGPKRDANAPRKSVF
jgi:DNA/RNA-binding protein KIN17